jgi:hypothetical protein
MLCCRDETIDLPGKLSEVDTPGVSGTLCALNARGIYQAVNADG